MPPTTAPTSSCPWRRAGVHRTSSRANVGAGLNKALVALEEANSSSLDGVLKHINFTKTVGKTTISDPKRLELIEHFDQQRLRPEDFEFPDLLGAAYEYLIGDFADSAGKKAGEFYTPRGVVRLMVRLADPTEKMRVYDPCSGSGGMLIEASHYVAEHGGNTEDLALSGQESNGGIWSISKMNMILHGISADCATAIRSRSPCTSTAASSRSSIGCSPTRRSPRTTSRRACSSPGASAGSAPRPGRRPT